MSDFDHTRSTSHYIDDIHERNAVFDDPVHGLNFNKTNHKSLWPEDSGTSGLDDFATDLVMALVLIPVLIFFFVVFFM